MIFIDVGQDDVFDPTCFKRLQTIYEMIDGVTRKCPIGLCANVIDIGERLLVRFPLGGDDRGMEAAMPYPCIGYALRKLASVGCWREAIGFSLRRLGPHATSILESFNHYQSPA